MVSASGELQGKLQGEADWHRAAVFTDAEEIIAANNCEVKADEVK
jgi:hypothetical protein